MSQSHSFSDGRDDSAVRSDPVEPGGQGDGTGGELLGEAAQEPLVGGVEGLEVDQEVLIYGDVSLRRRVEFLYCGDNLGVFDGWSRAGHVALISGRGVGVEKHYAPSRERSAVTYSLGNSWGKPQLRAPGNSGAQFVPEDFVRGKGTLYSLSREGVGTAGPSSPP
jgi:hypothetical protein